MFIGRPIARRLRVRRVRIADVIEEQIIRRLLRDFRRRHAHDGRVGGQLAGKVFEPLAAARFAGG